MFKVIPLTLRRSVQRAAFLFVLVLALSVASPKINAQNYLHTSGANIVDSHGSVVRLTGVSWFGMETANYCPHGLWQYSMNQYLDQIKSLGFNMIRVPYCNQLFDAGSTPNGLNNQTNADLIGLTGIQIMDQLVARCQTRGIKIILDRHRPDSGAQSALWYTSAYSEARWISDWQMLVTRYNGNDTVIGCDLHNEPHDPATWGDGSMTNDWRAAAQRCGNAILAINPNMLIVVEGIQTYAPTGDSGWWGGNLEGVRNFPVTLSVPNQVVYSPHDYPASVFNQTWFSDPTYPANLGPNVWDPRWGYIVKNGIAPLWVGEFGTLDVSTSDQQWFQAIVNYMTSNGMSWAFWSWNPDSGDTGGILKSDWLTVETTKMAVLTPALAPFIGSGPPTTVPPVPTGLTATAGDTQVVLTWSASSTASSYNVKRGTVSGGPYTTVSSPTGTSYTNTGLTDGTTYYFVVSALNSVGESANSTQASAKPTQAIPAAPAGLTATPGAGSIGLSWTAVSGATSYNVKRSTVTGNGYATVASPASSIYTNTGLAAGVTYFYVVSAVNAAGESANSAEASAMPGTSGPVAINSGGPAVSPFLADVDFSGGTAATNTGTVTTTGVTNPAPLAVYSTERWGPMTYTVGGLTVGGTYTVRLHFTEDYVTAASQREFNVAINGTTVLTNFDIFATAGAQHKATVQQFSTTANANGQVVIAFTVGAIQNPKVDGIEVISSTPTAPSAPTGLTATSGNAQVALAWNASSGATSYSVLRSTVSGSGYASTASGLTTTAFTNAGLTNGVTYYFVVTATNATGTSPQSAQASAAPAAPAPPSAPAGLAAAPGNAQVSLTWTASTGATSYNVLRSTVTGGPYTSVATGIATTSYTNTGLTNGTSYFYVVTATNANGTSGNSNQASATPVAPPPPPVPTGLAATAGNAQVSLTWNASTGATSYNVSRSTVSGSGYASVATGITVTNYTNTGLTNGITYYFVVSATNSAGTSANSAQASAMPNVAIPAVPAGLSATGGNAQVALTWSASTGATSYNVLRSTISGSGYASVATGITVTNYTNTGLTNGTTYYFVVSAANSAGTSGNSAQSSATPAAVTSTLKVQYKCNNVTTPGNQIQPDFIIVNTGSTSVALSTLKIRYYYTIDTTQPETFFCDYALVGNGNVSGTFNALSPIKTNADTYLEVGFNAAAGSIAANGNSGEVQVRFNKNDFSSFTQSNDYSFDPTKTAFADWNKVALYQNGTLVWGVTPP